MALTQTSVLLVAALNDSSHKQVVAAGIACLRECLLCLSGRSAFLGVSVLSTVDTLFSTNMVGLASGCCRHHPPLPPAARRSSSPLYQRRHEFVGELVAAVAREHAEGHSARSSLEAVQRELRDRHARHLAAVRRYEVALAQAQVKVYIQPAADVVTDHRAALV